MNPEQAAGQPGGLTDRHCPSAVAIGNVCDVMQMWFPEHHVHPSWLEHAEHVVSDIQGTGQVFVLVLKRKGILLDVSLNQRALIGPRARK